jgi:hypothetical protein
VVVIRIWQGFVPDATISGQDSREFGKALFQKKIKWPNKNRGIKALNRETKALLYYLGRIVLVRS